MVNLDLTRGVRVGAQPGVQMVSSEFPGMRARNLLDGTPSHICRAGLDYSAIVRGHGASEERGSGSRVRRIEFRIPQKAKVPRVRRRRGGAMEMEVGTADLFGPQIDDGDWPEDLFCIAIDTYTVILPPESVSSALLYGAS